MKIQIVMSKMILLAWNCRTKVSEESDLTKLLRNFLLIKNL